VSAAALAFRDVLLIGADASVLTCLCSRVSWVSSIGNPAEIAARADGPLAFA
jgi:hypothetical protein